MDAKPSVFKKYGGSLFYRLLASFAVVIVLLISLNMLTYAYFRSSIREEIVRNSSLNLSATVENYEKHIKLVKGMMIGFYFNDKTEILKNNTLQFNYNIARQEQLELQRTLSNPMLYLQNVAYYFANIDYVIDKDGAREAETMFGNMYKSAQYSASFWRGELAKPFTFNMYPAAEFSETSAFYTLPLGTLNPFVVKTASNPRFGIIGFLDSGKMYDSFHQVKTNSAFYILDPGGAPLFAVSDAPAKPLDFEPGGEMKGYDLQGTDYYFYEKGSESGFTYINVIPFAAMSQQIFRLNVITVTVLILSVIIGVAVSVFFAVRFQNPITAIIRSIQQVNTAAAPPKQSPIKEFNMISEKLHDLFTSNENIHKDLDVKNSLLQQYAYLCKAKMIQTDVQNVKIPTGTDKPFRLVLFHLLYKERFVDEMGVDQSRASNYIKEFISSLISGSWESLTMQIEKDQILTVLFGEDSEEHALSEILGQVADILSLDMRYCDVTIAVSPIYRDALAFNPAFEFAAGLLKQRKLGEGVQVIAAREDLPAELLLSHSEEKEFTANLASGNDDITIPLVMKALKQAANKQASVFQLYELSKEIVNLTVKSMYSINLRVLQPEDSLPSAMLYECRTLEQFQSFFRQFLTRSAEAVRRKKTESDHITSYVTDYVNQNFGSDLSLDVLSEKLNITGAYLSTYYKEKTGVNFSDYVNTVRMSKAMELLADTDLKVQDIAQLVGYYSIASFNRMFKKHTGFTPGEYRRSNAKFK